jgi:hypothetical protein
MQKEFVPYELVLKLKELGFDEECFCNWEESWSPEPEDEIRMVLTTDQTWLRPGWIRAPTFSQAFRWFREEHDLHYQLVPFFSDKESHAVDYYLAIAQHRPPIQVNTFEEAELACLDKLIEILEKNECSK